MPDYNCSKNNDDYSKNPYDDQQNGLIIRATAFDFWKETQGISKWTEWFLHETQKKGATEKRKTRVISGITTAYKKRLRYRGKECKVRSERVSWIEDHKEGKWRLGEGGLVQKKVEKGKKCRGGGKRRGETIDMNENRG